MCVCVCVCVCVWLIDFNDMSVRLGLSYDKILGNHVYCTFIFLCFVQFFILVLFLHSHMISSIFI